MGILESFPPASTRLIWASDHAEEARTWGPGTDTKALRSGEEQGGATLLSYLPP